MNKEERKNMLLTLPIETLVDLIIAGDEIEQRVFKAIEMLDKLNIQLKDVLKTGINIKEISDIKETLKGEDNE